MRWRRGTKSRDVIDQRGGGSGLKLAGIPAVIVVVLGLIFGRNLIGSDGSIQIPGLEGIPHAPPGGGTGIPPEADPDADLVAFVNFLVEDIQGTWQGLFQRAGRSYRDAELVLFDAGVQTGCGAASSDVGPFYCPPDNRVYIDLGFFRELKDRFGAPGDFAQAYVIAHEFGHHVQNVLGISDSVHQRQQQDPDGANELSVRLELQADCLAGVWGFTTRERGILEPGDLQEGLAAAAAVGDDRIQREATGSTNPETWTHGSSEQRTRWFRTGFDSGNTEACDTFAASNL